MFFTEIVHHIFSIRDNYIGYPKTREELVKVIEPCKRSYLPGCREYVDVMHVKWGQCPADNVNQCIGKEGYSSLAFEVIKSFNQQILGVLQAHFGTHNDKHII